MNKKKLSSLLVELVLLLAVLVVVLGLDHTRLGRQLENLTLDWRFHLRGPSDPPAHSDVLIVGIDEDSLAAYGRWPWSREVHAQLLLNLTTRAPKSVAFDLLFSEPSSDPAVDTAFGDALAQSPTSITGAAAERLENVPKFTSEYAGNTRAIANVVGDQMALVGEDTGLIPVQIIGESSFTGFVNAPPDADGIRRQLPLIVRCGEHVFPSLVLQSLLCSEGVQTDAVDVVLGKHIRIQGPHNTWVIPVDQRGQMTVNYRHPNTFPVFPYAGLVQQLNEFKGAAWPKEYPPVAGQMLFLGQTASGLADLGPTPHGPQIPLVLIHANALSNILSGDFIVKANFWLILGSWLLVAVVTIITLRNGPIWLAVLVPLLLMGLYVVTTIYVFTNSSQHWPMAWPVLGFGLVQGAAVLRRLVIELKAKSRIKSMFGTYLSPQVVEQMVASGEEPKLGGQESEITAFFSDIAGFSSFSEKLPPERLVALMNDYLTEMTDILHDNGGTLDKFIGDAIVGMFGAPLPFKGHAYHACCAALLMQKRQHELREKWRQEGDWPDIVYEMKTRIGLNSGLAIIGNMGSRRRFNYTMMGDTVNLAARSESGAKSYGVYTMITGETKALAENHRDDLAFRFLDKIVVKGRSQPAEVYELVGFKADLSADTKECLNLFQLGIERYLAQEWDTSQTLFKRAAQLETHTDSNPSLVFMKRCEAMRHDPPGSAWDGVYVMKTK